MSINLQYPSEQLLQTFSPLTPVPHCESIKAHIAPDFFMLWEEYEKERGCITEIPYWAAIWPGAKSLAAYILRNPSLVMGKRVLDFGAGSGVGSIAAAMSGASEIMANDIDQIALYIAQKNFKANSVCIKTDSTNLLTASNSAFYDLILVCDMFYERSTAQPLHEFLLKSVKRGSEVLIADGTRPFTPRKDLNLIMSEDIEVNKELEGIAVRRVNLLMMSNSAY